MAKIALLFVLTSIGFLVTQTLLKVNERNLEKKNPGSQKEAKKRVARHDTVISPTDEIVEDDNIRMMADNHTTRDENEKVDYTFMYYKAPLSFLEHIINELDKEHENHLKRKSINEQIKGDPAFNTNIESNNKKMKRDTFRNLEVDNCDKRVKRSCVGRCGMKLDIDFEKFFCQCDAECEKYGDCCPDAYICKDEEETEPTKATTDPETEIPRTIYDNETDGSGEDMNIPIILLNKTDTDELKVGNIGAPFVSKKKGMNMEHTPQSGDNYGCVKTEQGSAYFLFQSCDPSYTDPKTILNCLTITSMTNQFQITPVYGKQKQMHYRNMYCALCNYEVRAELQFWLHEVVCGHKLKQKVVYENPVVNFESIYGLLQSDGCTQHFKLPLSEKNLSYPRVCMQTINCDHCPSCKDKGFDPVSSDKGIYYNSYCAREYGFDGELSCNITSVDLADTLTDFFMSMKQFSFTFLLDFSDGKKFYPSLSIDGGKNVYGMADSQFSCFATHTIQPLFCETRKCPIQFTASKKECLPAGQICKMNVAITVNSTRIEPLVSSKFVTEDRFKAKLARFYETAINSVSSAFNIVGFVKYELEPDTPQAFSCLFHFNVSNNSTNQTCGSEFKDEEIIIKAIIYEGLNIEPKQVLIGSDLENDNRKVIYPILDRVRNATESPEDVDWTNGSTLDVNLNGSVVNAATGYARNETMIVCLMSLILMALWFCRAIQT